MDTPQNPKKTTVKKNTNKIPKKRSSQERHPPRKNPFKMLPPSCGAKSAKSAATRGAKKCPSSVPHSLSYGLSKVITPQKRDGTRWHGLRSSLRVDLGIIDLFIKFLMLQKVSDQVRISEISSSINLEENNH